ncbi:thioredoxin domain-containing protein [Bacteroidia bacterium]|nr:thioredoxin domain-containing protein [Bacteroidia bacterium]
MKSTTFLLFTTVLLISSSFSSGVLGDISFEDGKYSEVRKLAKEKNKTIFIDGYTQWCGPCKKMASTVFTDTEVGSYFNRNFINVKMDMEKTEGMLVGRRYGVNFYPTLLFIKPSGELVLKEVGYHSKSEPMRLAKDIANY